MFKSETNWVKSDKLNYHLKVFRFNLIIFRLHSYNNAEQIHDLRRTYTKIDYTFTFMDT